MIAAFERHEARAGNAGRDPAAFLERLHRVVAAMEHQCRDLHLRQQVGDVDVVRRPAECARRSPATW